MQQTQCQTVGLCARIAHKDLALLLRLPRRGLPGILLFDVDPEGNNFTS